MARGTSKKGTSSTRSRSNYRRGSTPLPTLGTPSRAIPKDKPTPRYGTVSTRLSDPLFLNQFSMQVDSHQANIPYHNAVRTSEHNVATGGSRRSPTRPRRGGR